MTTPSLMLLDSDGRSTRCGSSVGSDTASISPSQSSSPTSATSRHRSSTASNTPLIPTLPLATVKEDEANKKTSTPCPEGWPSLARALVDMRGAESFSRFRELNVKNLLYYQVEIAMLQDKLRKLEDEDANSARKTPSGTKNQRRRYAWKAEKMFQGLESSEPADRRQCELVLEIRSRLKEYNDALLQHVKISALPDPDPVSIDCLRIQLARGICGADAIKGCGSDAWGDFDSEEDSKSEKSGPMLAQILRLFKTIFVPRPPPLTQDKADLVAVHPRRKLDGLTLWVEQEWIPFWHGLGKKVQSTEDPRYFEPAVYSERRILKFTLCVSTVVACLLPTLAIGVLTTAETTLQKLLYIGLFTALFSIGLMWLTEANTSRVQIFTAAAAFSAVLVVFVQNQ